MVTLTCLVYMQMCAGLILSNASYSTEGSGINGPLIKAPMDDASISSSDIDPERDRDCSCASCKVIIIDKSHQNIVNVIMEPSYRGLGGAGLISRECISARDKE